jgi:hypothetical protein
MRGLSESHGIHVSTGLRRSSPRSTSEDRESRQQLLSCHHQRLGVLDGLMCLVVGGGLAGTRGVLEFVASSSHCSEGSKPVAELGTQSHLDCVVPAGRCWAQALVGQDRGIGVPSGVLGQDERAVGSWSAISTAVSRVREAFWRRCAPLACPPMTCCSCLLANNCSIWASPRGQRLMTRPSLVR